MIDFPVFSAMEKANQGEAAGSQSGGEERGDLIQFYNSVFVLKVKSFALRYATGDNCQVATSTHLGNCFKRATI